jgi:alpha-beta hydrolase superfamily lysophospholipase
MLETLSDVAISSGQISRPDKNKIYFKTISTPSCEAFKYRIFILHDLLKYHDPYIDLARKLIIAIGAPVQIVLFDLLGHGLSTGTRGHIDNYHEYVSDIDLVLNSYDLSNEEQRFIISEGFSALLILDYIYSHHQMVKNKFAGIILANPAIKVKSLQNYLNKKELPSFVPKIFQRIRIPFITFSTQNLLRDSFLRYDKVDPLIMQNGSLKLVQEIYGLSQRIRPMPYLFDLPFLFLVNNQDVLLDIPLVKTFFKGLSGEKSQILEYDQVNSGALLLEDTEEISGVINSWLQSI